MPRIIFSWYFYLTGTLQGFFFFMPVFIQALHKFSIYIPSLIDRDDQI